MARHKTKSTKPKLSEVLNKLVSLKKGAWYPVTEKKVSSVESSKFSGVPLLRAGEKWPCCHHCNQPMQLFLQLNSKELPAESGSPFGEGYLQVFYCTNADPLCEVECEAYFPFAKSTLVRVLAFDVALKAAHATDPSISPVNRAFPENAIVGWKMHDDYPSWEEQLDNGIELPEEENQVFDGSGFPLANDKLLGWPLWMQGVEYPDCPKCGEKMQLVFQIDSDNNIPYLFGDVGCSHITQCKQHPEILTIAWACG